MPRNRQSVRVEEKKVPEKNIAFSNELRITIEDDRDDFGTINERSGQK